MGGAGSGCAGGLTRPPRHERIGPPLDHFLQSSTLVAGIDKLDPNADAVTCMTMHNAKGLEFPLVFVSGLEDGLFPLARAAEDPSQLEEERRLFYVGITRAREKLFISYAESRRIHGVEQICAPSQFLKEIPKECTMELRPRAGVLRSQFGIQSGRGGYTTGGPVRMGSGYSEPQPWRERQQEGYNLSRPSLPARMAETTGTLGFRMGQSVRHASFGEGVILSFDGEGERARVEIRFAGSGTKWLMLGLAKLQGL